MKRLFLVKGSERHEVEMVDGRYNFCALGHMITPAVAVLLGYELQEVNEREECWMVVMYAGTKVPHVKRRHAEKYKEAYGGTIKHMVALEDDEKIVSRDDVRRAVVSALQDTRGLKDLDDRILKELGFGEGER